MEQFESYEEFWVHFVRAHTKKSTRRIHFAGFTAGLVAAAVGLATPRRALLLAAPVIALVPGLLSHYLVEGNRPVTAKPLWALRADFEMWLKTLAGTMDDEVLAATASPEPPRQAAAPQPNMRTDGTLN